MEQNAVEVDQLASFGFNNEQKWDTNYKSLNNHPFFVMENSTRGSGRSVNY